MNFTAIGQSFLTNLHNTTQLFTASEKKTPSTSLEIKFNENNVSVFRSKLLSLNLIANEVGSVQEFFFWFCRPLVFS